MVMSELSITELQAESVELLPERETLSIIEILNTGSASAVGDTDIVTNTSSVVYAPTTDVIGSFDTAILGSFNTHFGI